MILTIHQPEFMPWLGFLDKASLADTIVFLDNVQYRHKYFQNRNKIKDINGKDIWLNIPIIRNGKTRNIGLIKDIKIDNNQKWSKKILKTIEFNYRKSPNFTIYYPVLEEIFLQKWNKLVDLNINIISKSFDILNINTKIIRSSELRIEGSGEKLILDICKHFSPKQYISGPTGIAGRGKEYEPNFINEGIEVIYHNFEHPTYEQINGPFISHMSFIDKLFNNG
tara:strand:+ start:243 stop:914 length:672 start_codon:yes stop_codon:yes gene_type:complete